MGTRLITRLWTGSVPALRSNLHPPRLLHDLFTFNRFASTRIVPKRRPTRRRHAESTGLRVLPPKQTSSAQLAQDLPLDSILKIYCWQMKGSVEHTGSAPGLILTNAHVVANHTYITVKTMGTTTRLVAEVVAIAHECDLALLRVNDFHAPPLPLGELPSLQEDVAVVGYPTGGENVCVTAGVVSRIEPQPYAHGGRVMLTVQIDAAINQGNSGGPVLRNNTVIGVVFQKIAHGAENIPVPIIKHFLDDISKHGKYTGFGSLGILCQMMDNPQLRAYYSLSPDMSGVLVTSTIPGTDAARALKKDDVILSVDSVAIANDGTIPFQARSRIFFEYLLMNKFMGDSCKMRVLRQGKELEVDVKLTKINELVPPHDYEKRPSYFTYGGLVFTVLTTPYMQEWGDDWWMHAPRKLSSRSLYQPFGAPGQQVVILSRVLVDEVNYGYNNLHSIEVLSFNGTPIKNLRHLVELVESNDQPYARFDLDDYLVILLETKKVAATNDIILQKHGIPSAKSLDLLQPPADTNNDDTSAPETE